MQPQTTSFYLALARHPLQRRPCLVRDPFGYLGEHCFEWGAAAPDGCDPAACGPVLHLDPADRIVRARIGQQVEFGQQGQPQPAGGHLADRIEAYEDRLEDVEERREELELRWEKVRARYTDQFNALDTLLSQLQSTSSYLEGQLANLPKPNSVKSNS